MELRANPLSIAAEQGCIKLVEGNWINDFLDEFEMFPEGANDDIADTTSGAFRKFTKNIPLGGNTVPSIFG